jgi:hypothetical protein
MKQDINFIVPYWNMNSCETWDCDPDPPLCRKSYHPDDRRRFSPPRAARGKIISLSGLSTLLKRGEKAPCSHFPFPSQKRFIKEQN